MSWQFLFDICWRRSDSETGVRMFLLFIRHEVEQRSVACARCPLCAFCSLGAAMSLFWQSPTVCLIKPPFPCDQVGVLTSFAYLREGQKRREESWRENNGRLSYIYAFSTLNLLHVAGPVGTQPATHGKKVASIVGQYSCVVGLCRVLCGVQWAYLQH